MKMQIMKCYSKLPLLKTNHGKIKKRCKIKKIEKLKKITEEFYSNKSYRWKDLI
jgi:hypothetical protein